MFIKDLQLPLYTKIIYDSPYKFKVGGNILSLLTPSMTLDCIPKYCFTSLFCSNRGIVDASNLILPHFTSENCYTMMFEFCNNLKYPPNLPAIFLEPLCYCNMFKFSMHLETTPTIPQTIAVADKTSFLSMFSHTNDKLETTVVCLTDKLGHISFDNEYASSVKFN